MRLQLVVLVALTCPSCLAKDHVVFATNSSIGLDLDSKPPTVSIAFSRQEGSMAPVTDKGEVLPLITSFSGGTGFSGVVFGADIAQSFAIGNAGWLLSRYLTDIKTDVKSLPESAAAPPADIFTSAAATAVDGMIAGDCYVFTTNTTLGLRVGFSATTGGLPDALSFGWKRKELAIVPTTVIGTGASAKLAVAPMIALTGSSSTAQQGEKTNVGVTQLYATGHAATFLAADPLMRKILRIRIVPDERLTALVNKEQAAVDVLKQLGEELGRTAATLIDRLDIPGLDAAYHTAAGLDLISWDADDWATRDKANKVGVLKAATENRSVEEEVQKIECFNQVLRERLGDS